MFLSFYATRRLGPLCLCPSFLLCISNSKLVRTFLSLLHAHNLWVSSTLYILPTPIVSKIWKFHGSYPMTY